MPSPYLLQIKYVTMPETERAQQKIMRRLRRSKDKRDLLRVRFLLRLHSLHATTLIKKDGTSTLYQ